MKSSESPMRREDIVRRQWFTYLESTGSQDGKIEPSIERTTVDERFREDLSERLQMRIPFEPLPSTAFLNSCVQMYFNRFSPIFTIVHAATFRPSSTSSLLLLANSAIGSSFLGFSQAKKQGDGIFERLNKAILASWEIILSRGPSDAMALIQASLIAQTFSLLSGVGLSPQKESQQPPFCTIFPRNHHNAQWARRSGIFSSQRTYPLCKETTNERLEYSRKVWVQEETQARISAAFLIHDAELSLLFNVEPNLRHFPLDLPSISPNAAWIAQTPQEWKTTLENSSSYPTLPGYEQSGAAAPSQFRLVSDKAELDSFRAYCELEGIAASIDTAKELGALSSTATHLQESLLEFFKSYLKRGLMATRDPFCLRILWHSAYISLFVDLNRLEIAAGRDGLDKSKAHMKYVEAWSRSQEGRRCALHGAMILRNAEITPVRLEPAIHVPRALYSAAMVWYSYLGAKSEDTQDTIPSDNFPEFKTLGIDSSDALFGAHGFKLSRPQY